MSICYSETREPFTGNVAPYHTWKATERYLEHYANLLLLSFLANNSKDSRERHQAAKEQAIARRKLSYWEKHPNFDKTEALKGVQTLKRQWAK